MEVKKVGETEHKEYYEVGYKKESVIYDKETQEYSCTCKSCSLFPDRVCVFKDAVNTYRIRHKEKGGSHARN